VVVSACNKSSVITPGADASTVTGTIDGKTISVTGANISTTFYSSAGDNVNALQATANTDANGNGLTFYIPDISVTDNAISPKLGTSSNPGNATLAIQATGATSTTTQVYVRYKTDAGTFYAISGTVTVTTDNTKITVKWSLTFTDATGRVFTSTGSFVLYNYKTVTQPKTTIVDPTPVALKPTIGSIAATSGAAGDSVVIAGTNFSTALTENLVKFNGVTAVVKSATATKLVVMVPSGGSTGAITVRVKNSETATGPVFTYVTPLAAPTITGVTPLSGSAGDVMTIIGSNFSTTLTDDVVTIGNTTAKITILTASVDRITLTIPQGVVSGQVGVKVAGKAATVGANVSTLFTVK